MHSSASSSRASDSPMGIRCTGPNRLGAAALALLLMLTAGCATSSARLPELPAEPSSPATAEGDTDLARRLAALAESSQVPAADPHLVEGGQRIGPDDQLEVLVLEAPELSRTTRVSAQGEISLPLLGEVRAAGLTPVELQRLLEDQLRKRYILDPHVTVQVTEVQSKPISVVGAVNRPGILQVRGPRTLVEVLALAGGLSEDAGENVLVVRGGSTARYENASLEPAEEVQEVSLHRLLETGDPRHNVAVYPGDAVKVGRAGIIYVVGEVREPGVFQLSSHSGLTVMQAVALGKGLRPTAARSRATIIRTNTAGERSEIQVNLEQVLTGRVVDPPLQARDIVFVPNSAVKSVALGVVEGLVRMVTLRAVF